MWDTPHLEFLPNSIESVCRCIPQTSRYQDWSNVDFTAKNEGLDLFDQFTDAVSQAAYNERVNFGHQIEDMILACTFKGYPCSPS